MSNNKLYIAALMTGVSVFSLPSLSLAQQQQTAGTAAEIEAVVVTGTRIKTDGYEAPTPVTVVGVADLLKAAPGNIPDALNQLPQFLNSTDPNHGRKLGPQNPHGNFLNLRNVGANRTLIMLDNVRVPPTAYSGVVNVDIIPNLLVERVEVVTAGASAAYGSDAVAGVANFILDHNFTGVKAAVQSGISTYGDAFNYRTSAAGGFKIGDRGHLLVSLEHYSQDSFLMSDRPYSLDAIAAGRTPGAGAAGTAANPLVFYTNARWSIISDGGVVLAGPLSGTYFPVAGQSRAFNPGTPTGTNGFGIGGDGTLIPAGQTLNETADSTRGLARVNYEFTDDITGYAMVLASTTVGKHIGPGAFAFNTQIFSGNAFLPASVQAQMTGANAASFLLQKYTVDNGYLPGRDQADNYSIFAGLDGKLGAGYTWNINYARGHTKHAAQGSNLLELRKFAAAVDAVRDPATGNIVCRVTLTDPGVWPGCVPYNAFGVGSASRAAVDYVVGVSDYTDVNSTDQFSASAQGDLFSIWAGPISVAAGAEYRRQSLSMSSNADPGVVRPVTGLRGIAVNQSRFFFSNVGTASRSINVKEGFGEVNVPLAKDVSLARDLDVNAAVRVTDYSTSGTVTTWKFGGTWRPVDDINFRATRSRDIRAPTLFDLFSSGNFSRSGINDPHTNTASAADITGGGNPNLKPEKGKTLTFGFVYTPSFLPSFNFALDYFDVKLTGAISTLNANTIMLLCEQSNGTSPICAQITRPFAFTDRTPANTATAIRTVASNSSYLLTRGYDLEASYRQSVGEGSLTGRLLLSYVGKFDTQQSAIAAKIHQGGRGDGGNAIPRIKATFNVSYELGNVSLFVQERMLGKVNLGTTLIYAEPPVPAQYYTDTTFSYGLDRFGADVNLFLTVNNLFNNKPPLVPGVTAPGFGIATIPIYDVIGRAFTLGTRVKF